MRSPILTTALLAPALVAGASAVQTSPAEDLLGPGDVLPNGEVVDWIFDAVVSDAGSWALLVQTTAFSRAVVQDGAIVMAEGDILPSGDEVIFIRDIDMAPSGALGYAMAVGTPTSGRDIVYSQGQVLLEEFTTFPDPDGSPDDYLIRDFDRCALAYPYVVVETRVNGGGNASFRAAAIRFDVTVPTAPVAAILWEEGELSPGGGVFGPKPIISSDPDVLFDGRTLTVGTVLGDDVVLFDGVEVGRDRELAPDPTYRWTGGGVYDAQITSAGHLMLSGDVDLDATGAFEGRRVFVDGVLRNGPGQPFGSGTTGPYFYSPAVDRHGRVHFTHDSTTVEGYGIDGEMMMEAGLCTVGGELVLALNTFELVAISDSGRHVILTAPTGDPFAPDIRYGRLETELGGIAGSCPTVANTSGQVGTLLASGSTALTAGPFPMTAAALPPFQAGLLLCSQTPGLVANPGGSVGNLCLGGGIGRFMGQIAVSGADGAIDLTIDPLALPQPAALVAAAPGDLWGFQMWHRDTGPGGAPISNFTEVRVIGFR